MSLTSVPSSSNIANGSDRRFSIDEEIYAQYSICLSIDNRMISSPTSSVKIRDFDVQTDPIRPTTHI